MLNILINVHVIFAKLLREILREAVGVNEEIEASDIIKKINEAFSKLEQK